MKSCIAEGGLQGCVVVMSTFFIMLLAFGTSNSFGVYTTELLAAFDSGAAAVALVGSLNLGFSLGTGVGYSMVLISSSVLCSLYFPKHQSFSTGIAVGGCGFGPAIFPVVIHNTIQYYGWRGSLFFIAGLNLHLFVLAVLMKPVQNKVVESDENEVVESLPSIGQLTLREKVKKYILSVFTIEFLIFCISCICWNAGSAIIFIFFPDYAFNAGLSKEYASASYTLVGVGTGTGCVLGGVLGNLKCTNRIMLYLLANIGTGLIALIIPLKVSHTLHGLAVTCFVYGLIYGIIVGLLVVVTTDLLGMKTLGDGIGYIMLSNGIGVFSGPPIAGLLIDAYGGLDPAIYLSGALTIMGGIIMYTVIARRKFCTGG